MKNPITHYRRILENTERFSKTPVDYDLDPVISDEAFDLHYNRLYDGYVKRAIAGDDSDFTLGGVHLHRMFFEGLRDPRSPNPPRGEIAVLLEEQFGGFREFKDQFTEECLGVQGSAWVYLSRQGDIKTIPNHRPVKDVALILDMWEHAYVMDYGSDRAAYVKKWWSIIDWDVVNVRLGP